MRGLDVECWCGVTLYYLTIHSGTEAGNINIDRRTTVCWVAVGEEDLIVANLALFH